MNGLHVDARIFFPEVFDCWLLMSPPQTSVRVGDYASHVSRLSGFHLLHCAATTSFPLFNDRWTSAKRLRRREQAAFSEWCGIVGVTLTNDGWNVPLQLQRRAARILQCHTKRSLDNLKSTSSRQYLGYIPTYSFTHYYIGTIHYVNFTI